MSVRVIGRFISVSPGDADLTLGQILAVELEIVSQIQLAWEAKDRIGGAVTGGEDDSGLAAGNGIMCM